MGQRASPRRLYHGAAFLLGSWAIMNQFRWGYSTSSNSDSCNFEGLSCLSDADCGSCLEALQDTTDTIGENFTNCSMMYSSLCSFAADNGCDVSNTALLDFAACTADADYGCSDFVSCADFLGDTPATTGTPTPAPSTVAERGGVTAAPSGSDETAEAGVDDSGVAHTFSGATRATLALVLGLALLLTV